MNKGRFVAHLAVNGLVYGLVGYLISLVVPSPWSFPLCFAAGLFGPTIRVFKYD